MFATEKLRIVLPAVNGGGSREMIRGDGRTPNVKREGQTCGYLIAPAPTLDQLDGNDDVYYGHYQED